MADCRNARVRLRRRLEKKYPLKRVSVTTTKIDDKVVPKVSVTIDMNHRKNDFISDEYPNFKKEESDFVIKIVYYEDVCLDYKMKFIVDNIDIGIGRIKMICVGEIMDNVIPELKKLYEEVKAQ